MQKLIHWLGIGLFVGVLGLLTTGRVTAAPEATIDYNVAKNGRVRVQADYALSSNPGQLTITLPTTDISGLKVAFDNGAKLPHTTTETQVKIGSQQTTVRALKLDFTRWHRSSLPSRGFTVSYVAGGLVQSLGGARVLKIPAVGSQIEKLDGLATVRVPSNFPSVHATGGAAEFGRQGSQQFFTFQLGKLTDNTIWLSFGKVGHWQVQFKGDLENNLQPGYSTWSLPLDLSYQTTALDNVKPPPDRRRLDTHGNSLVQYWQWPLQSTTVESTTFVSVKQLNYRLNQAGSLQDVPDSLKTYTQATDFWPTEAAGSSVQEKIGESDSLAARIRKTYNYFNKNHSLNDDPLDFDQAASATSALGQPETAISRLTFYDLLVSSLRHQGIPARMVVGFVASSQQAGQPTVWVEAYLPNVGWLMLDKTTIDQLNGLGYTLADHIGLFVVGDATTRRQADQLVNRLQQTEVEIAPAKAKDARDASKINISGHRYSLLPGLSLDVSRLQAESQQAITGVQFETDQYQQNLGAFAPRETKTLARFVWGGPAFQSGEAKAAFDDQEYSADLPLSWWPLPIFLVVLPAALVIGWKRSQMDPVRRQTKAKPQNPRQPAAEDINLLPQALYEQPKVNHHPVNSKDNEQ